jgi:hypothetical protein
MAGAQFTLNEIVALINEQLPPAVPAIAAPNMMNALYAGSTFGPVPPADRINNDQMVALINAAVNNDNFISAVARIMGIRTNEFITELINSHNPYTSDNMTDMNIYTGNPDLSQWADNKTNQIEVEVDGPYSMPKEWYFKGLPQQINKALRIKYRYKAVNLGARPHRPPIKPPHWITAYMLIGYEDGGA